MKILVDAHIPYLKGVIEQFGDITYLSGSEFSPEAVRDKDALIVRTVTHFGKDMLENSRVKLICSATIGYDHIDTDYCDSHNIAWRTAPGCNADSVEQYITASLLYMAQKNGWDIRKKTIGIVGVGNVGSRVATACEKLGMRVLKNDPPRQEKENLSDFVALDIIQRDADIVTLHVPLTKEGVYATHHLANSSFFDELQRSPLFINSCRGAVMDTAAVKQARHSGKISGLVIDCWENEPHIDRELLQLSDIATPHIAGYSADGKWNASRMSFENVNEFFNCGISPIPFVEIPSAPSSIISLDELPVEEQLSHAVWHTYHPIRETEELKSHPNDFSRFRSEYPLRREYKAYTLVGGDADVRLTLQSLGFAIQ